MRMEGELGPRGRRGGLRGAGARARSATTPRWDLLLLGLGPDAHTRVAVPRQAGGRGALAAGRRRPSWPGWSRRCRGSRSRCRRSTRRARVVFLVTGEDKAQAVRRAFGDPPDPASPGGARAPAARRAARAARRRPRPRSSMSDQFIGIDVGGTKIAVGRARGRRAVGVRRSLHDRAGARRTRWSSSSRSAIERRAHAGDARGRHRHAVDHRVRDRPDPRQREHPAPGRAAARAADRARRACRSTSRTTRAARRWPRRSTTAGSPCSHLVMFTIGTGVGGGWVLNGRALPRRDDVGRRGRAHDHRARPRRRRPRARATRSRSAGSLETLASGPRARPAGRRRRDQYRGLATSASGSAAKGEIDGHDVVDGARGGRRRRRCAACGSLGERLGHRHRQRDQHLRPARGRDRRRRLARRRAAARAGARRGVPPRRARARA